MSPKDMDSTFSSRVYQGHVQNFRRKVDSAEDAESLERLKATFSFALEKGMIDEAARNDLLSAIKRRVDSMHFRG